MLHIAGKYLKTRAAPETVRIHGGIVEGQHAFGDRVDVADVDLAPAPMEDAVSGKFTEKADEVVSGITLIREGAPEAMKAFAGLSIAATAPKALDSKTKELIALAVGIAVHCDGCVAYHTRSAWKHGASRQEVAETVATAIYMGGGPAAVYGADALRAYDEFAQSA